MINVRTQNKKLHLSPKEIDAALAKVYGDLTKFGPLFYPNRFTRKFDQVHHDFANNLTDRSSRKNNYIAPRGTGKTTFISLVFPSHEILYQETNFYMPVSATHQDAVDNAANLRNELEYNPLINYVYGNVQGRTYSQEKYIIKVANHETLVMPRGAMDPVRGKIFGAHRPDLVTPDDVEKGDIVRSSIQRQRFEDWFFGDLLNVIDRGANNWRFHFVGTVLHNDSLLMNLAKRPDWKTHHYSICDDEYNSLMPNFLTTEQVKDLRFVEFAGKADIFAREYRGIAQDPENVAFAESMFKYYEETDTEFLASKERLASVIICDPSRTANPKNAKSAGVVFGINTDRHKIHVRDIINGHYKLEEYWDRVVEKIIQYDIDAVAVEVTGLADYAIYPLKNALASRGVYNVEIIELHARGGRDEKGKIARIRTLIGPYSSGIVYHNQDRCRALETQLLDFPVSDLWDVMDAAGYITEVMQKYDQYMFADLRAERDQVIESFELDDVYDEAYEFDDPEDMEFLLNYQGLV